MTPTYRQIPAMILFLQQLTGINSLAGSNKGNNELEELEKMELNPVYKTQSPT